jgi:hypothetical protein
LGFEKFIYESNSSIHNKSDLEVYQIYASFDILASWRVNSPKYPIISRMARDILGVLPTTMAFKSTLSLAKRVLGDYHYNLLLETMIRWTCIL